MIISASRRTDIPAFYSEWFLNRIEAGFCDVRNPMAFDKVSRISLSPEVVDCIVFWTKNPTNMVKHLDRLKDYKYYFQFTITPYGQELEKHVPSKDQMIEVAHEIASKIGSKRLVWRYDPIFISSQYPVSEHIKHFERLAKAMAGSTEKCVISFYDEYKPIPGIMQPSLFEIENLVVALQQIAATHGFVIETCSETFDLTTYGIINGKCIDDRLISEIIGQPLVLDKDKGQRKECGCVTSIDIGAYSCCKHGCVYCYAQRAELQLQKHQVDSTMLLGKLGAADKVIERKMESYKKAYIEETF